MNVTKDIYPISETMKILHNELANKEVNNFKIYLNNETLYFTAYSINYIKFCNGYIDLSYQQLTPERTCRLVLRYRDIVGFDVAY